MTSAALRRTASEPSPGLGGVALWATAVATAMTGEQLGATLLTAPIMTVPLSDHDFVTSQEGGEPGVSEAGPFRRNRGVSVKEDLEGMS